MSRLPPPLPHLTPLTLLPSSPPPITITITPTTSPPPQLPSLLPTNTSQVANLELFDVERSISLVPPDGEFALANYRTSHGIRPPFRLSIGTEPDAASEYKVRGQTVEGWE